MACILVVEDEYHMRRSLATALSHRGHVVIVAETAAKAFEAATGARIDLMICDVGLPDYSGPELAQRLSEELPQPIPTIYITGFADEDLARHGWNRTDAILLKKPFTFSKLIDAIEGVLAGQR